MKMEAESAGMYLLAKEHQGSPATTRRRRQYGADSLPEPPEGTCHAATLILES